LRSWRRQGAPLGTNLEGDAVKIALWYLHERPTFSLQWTTIWPGKLTRDRPHYSRAPAPALRKKAQRPSAPARGSMSAVPLSDAARAPSVTVQTCRRWVQEGAPIAGRRGKGALVIPEEIAQWAKAHHQQQPAATSGLAEQERLSAGAAANG
jgi:hypothetical protein